MKRKTFQKHICFFLALFMIFSLTACNGNNEVPDQQTQETEAATRPRVSKSFVPTEDYVIVRSDLYAADPNISDACFYLKKALEKAYGITVKIETDSVKASASRREFLVGVTNRPESQDAYTVLELDEYTYNVASEKVIVMCGGTPAMTYEAVKKFCLDLLTYDGKSVETKNTPLKTLKKFSQNDVKYEYSTVTINGILLEDYALVVSSSSDIAGAIELSQRIGQYTGQILPIRHVSEMTGEEESIIRIGAAYRDGKGSNKLNGYMINNYVDEKGTVICIDAASTDMYKNALDDFFSKTEKNVDGSTVAFTVNEETVYSVTTTDRYGGNKTAEYVHWDLTLETTQELADGLTYIEQTFYDDAGLPYRVYTLIVDTEKYTFDMGTANDGFDYTVTKADKQTTQQHMQAAVKNGKNVVAGINTDFFDIEDGYLLDDNHPFGMTIICYSYACTLLNAGSRGEANR